MAITLQISPAGDDPLTEIQSTTRTNRSVNATITAIADFGEIISSVTAISLQNETDIQITSDISSVTIVGKYVDPFSDKFTYVNKGSSDKLQSPTTVIGAVNLPLDKDLFKLQQDTREYTINSYMITVVSDLGTENFTVTHKILNEWDGIKTLIDEYYTA